MARIYIALDIETTGLQAEHDAIIEIGAVKFRGDQVLDTWSSLVNPKRPIPYKIRLLTGIDQAEVDRAPSIFSVTGQLIAFVKDYPIVGHNVRFDLSFLNRHGLFLANPAIDTFELASILMPHATRYSLDKLARMLDISFPTQHRALADAMAAKDLFLALSQRALQLDLGVIQEINRLAARSDWPLRYIFHEVEKERARSAFTGTIRQQLMAKGGEDILGFILSKGRVEEPLRPSPRREPLDVKALSEMLEEEGFFARCFPNYEYRPQQVAMLRAVSQAFNDGERLLVEAGTGVGKSLAYLIPAVHFATQNGERIVVSTNTINLQDQLFDKDIPDLQRILPLEFKATLLKGRTNYLCPRRLAIFRRRGNPSGLSPSGRSLSLDEIRMLAKILVWLPMAASGDRAELALSKQELPLWGRVCADAENCLAERCPYRQRGRCFFYRARQLAESAHIIVVNHSLLLSDMVMENQVLPSYRYLIIDEAHHLEARATEQLSFAVDQAQASAFLDGLSQRLGEGRHSPGLNPGLLAEIPNYLRAGSVPVTIRRDVEGRIQEMHRGVEEAQRALYELFNVLALFLEEHSEEAGNYDQRIRLTNGLRIQPAWASVEIAWDNLSLRLSRIAQGLEGLYNGLLSLEDYDILNYDDLLQELLARLHQIRDLQEQMNAIIVQPSPGGIYWVTIRAKDENISLHSAPLHVGELLNKHLFSPKECVVLTSATLRTEGDFAYIRDRLGLQDAQELAVGSPFDYATSTLLYLPTDIPDPGRPYYQKTVERVLTDLCRATKGRTLVLFTSYSQLRATHKAITRPLEEEGIVVLGQSLDGSRRQRLESFKSDQKTVLLGTRSFWEGIDVVGEALSCLAIARLPFSVPTDPIFAARSETFEDPFGQYAVPEAILRFRQGFGRLIRSRTDRGVLVILDKRVLTKPYGSAFLNSLPTCTVRCGSIEDLPSEAARWIEGKTSYQQGLGL
ncbi:MAG: helicase C-terminal domain-containing protein [Dehalococcoidia bacterium]